MEVIYPTYTPQTGWRGVQVTAKIHEDTIGMVFGWFSARNSNFGSILAMRPPVAVIHPIYTRQTGWGGVQVTSKMDENTIGIVFGCFWARNSNFGSILATRPPMAVIHPIYTPQTGWRGCKLPPKWMKTQSVWLWVVFAQAIPISNPFWSCDPIWRSLTPYTHCSGNLCPLHPAGWA